jgi:hypothetical protein
VVVARRGGRHAAFDLVERQWIGAGAQQLAGVRVVEHQGDRFDPNDDRRPPMDLVGWIQAVPITRSLPYQTMANPPDRDLCPIATDPVPVSTGASILESTQGSTQLESPCTVVRMACGR